MTLQARSIGPCPLHGTARWPGALRVNGYSGSHRRSGGPTLDDISTDLILGDLVQAHVGIAMLRQPAPRPLRGFGLDEAVRHCRHIPGGCVPRMAGRSTISNRRSQSREYVRLIVSTTTPPLPKSPSWSVKLAGEIQFGRSLAGSFLTRRPAPLRFSHAASFFLKRAGGLGVPSE